MTEDHIFCDSAGHSFIDVDPARMPQMAANDDVPPVPRPDPAVAVETPPKG